MKCKTEERENRKRKTQRCYSMSSRRARQQANVKRQAVYRGKRKQRESSGKHFGLPSGWLPELLRARTRACLTSLVSLGMRESRWGALRDRGGGGTVHLQLNKQLEARECLPPASAVTNEGWMKIAV